MKAALFISHGLGRMEMRVDFSSFSNLLNEDKAAAVPEEPLTSANLAPAEETAVVKVHAIQLHSSCFTP